MHSGRINRDPHVHMIDLLLQAKLQLNSKTYAYCKNNQTWIWSIRNYRWIEGEDMIQIVFGDELFLKDHSQDPWFKVLKDVTSREYTVIRKDFTHFAKWKKWNFNHLWLSVTWTCVSVKNFFFSPPTHLCVVTFHWNIVECDVKRQIHSK